MEARLIIEAIGLAEQANEGVAGIVREPAETRRLLDLYVRLERLAAYGKATLSARVGDATRLARSQGTSVGAARRAIDTGRALAAEPRLAEATRRGDVSVDQAGEIAAAASADPGALDDLLDTARTESFRTLRDRARSVRLQAGDREALASRQRRARRLRHWIGDGGMVRLDAALEPHVGAAVVSRIEREANRIARRSEESEPFERHLADGLAASVSGDDAPSKAEVVVLVSHEVVARGWSDVEEDEHCAIPGVGPIAPSMARRLADDAFLTGVVCDGTDLRQMKRWTRSIPVEVRLALHLGEAPGFAGPACVDCGNRFRLEVDHVDPVANGGPTSLPNTELRCEACHRRKTRDDRAAGMLAGSPAPARGP
ncbi:MAG: HNH endonuclease [Acidimicrobiia bacterium]|nr:HNH endonuclease [Acidimicrobiia bacterium]